MMSQSAPSIDSPPQIREVPFTLVGGNTFGIHPKISNAETFNMLVSDGFFVPFAGYKKRLTLLPGGLGRDIYSSSVGNIMLSVISNNVYIVGSGITQEFIGTLATTSGNIYISENNAGQIAITDGVNLYVYKYPTQADGTTSFTFQTSEQLGFKPGYITFQNSRFIVASIGTNIWRLSELNNVTFPDDAQHQGTLQTKPDNVVGALRFPGRGNLLFIFGKTVTEPWNDIGAALFPYVRLDSFNVDYGCLSANTIAENETIIVWLAANEQSGPAIMYSTGSDVKKISTDGIDFKLSQLTAPQDSYGFLFRQNGHQIYMITFKTDNLTYFYDFNTGLFFTATNEYLDHHIAKRVVFFNNKYYFVSFDDGNLYEFGSNFTDFEYSDDHIKEIPRIRIGTPNRLPNSKPYICRSISFLIENGQPNKIIKKVYYNEPFVGDPITTQGGLRLTTQDGRILCTQQNFNTTVVEEASEAVDLSFSRDGAVTFGHEWRKNMNPTGKRKSKFQYQRLGWVNDFTYQLRFWGFGRFIVGDGTMEIYQ